MNSLHLVSQNIVLIGKLLVQLLDSHACFARGHSQLDIGGVLPDGHIKSLDLHLENVTDEREAAGPRLRVLHVGGIITYTSYYEEVVVVILLKLLCTHLDNARVLAHALKLHL